MELPPDLPLDCLIDDLYEIKTLDRSSWMARLVDVEAGLQGLKCPKGDWQCTIRLLDSFLLYNSGVYQLVHSGDELEIIKVKGDTVDLSLSIQALTQLCLGYLSLDMALLRDDTTLYGNRALLSKLFAARPVYMAEKF